MKDRIKQLRLSHGMSQEDLAKACGVTKSAVSQWESGSTENIRLQTFLSLCKALHTFPEFLIFGPESERLPNKAAGHG